MKDYLKNKNEYIEDGKRYIEQIKSCDCIYKVDTTYFLDCKIHQRGLRTYRYTAGTEYIEKDLNPNKKLYLDFEAKQTIEKTTAAFEGDIKEALNSGAYTSVWVEGLDGFVYYKRVMGPFSRRYFNAVIRFQDDNGKNINVCLKNCSLSDMLNAIHRYGSCFGKKSKVAEKALEYIIPPRSTSVVFNPIYESAEKENDVLTQCELKLLYRIADEAECRYIAEKENIRILPSLPDKYDKDYIVSTDGFYNLLLKDSGYRILHRPHFAMKGSTRDKRILNPHTKTGVDAAPEDAQAISFEEFLALFDEYENSKLK